MIFFRIVELTFILIMIFLIVTQIIIPSFQNKPIFPLFRDEFDLYGEEEELNQQQAEEELRQEIAAKQEVLDKLRGEKNGSSNPEKQ